MSNFLYTELCDITEVLSFSAGVDTLAYNRVMFYLHPESCYGKTDLIFEVSIANAAKERSQVSKCIIVRDILQMRRKQEKERKIIQKLFKIYVILKTFFICD